MEGVRALKEEIEKKTGLHLKQAATAIPPGTGEATHKSHAYVVETAGLEVVQVVDEPTAANRVLGVANGAVVDIGGGTTGVAVFCDGEVVYTADEPTGGTHITLVLSGRYGISFTEAEKLKLILPGEKRCGRSDPVIEKMGTNVGNTSAGPGRRWRQFTWLEAPVALRVEDIIAGKQNCRFINRGTPLVTPWELPCAPR